MTVRLPPPPDPARRRLATALAVAFVIASLTSLSAHVVRGVVYRDDATAFVASPSAAQDAPLKIMWAGQDTGLRVVCFHVVNTSPRRVDDPAWPRVTAVGFELPEQRTGFSLLQPLDGNWELAEGMQVDVPNRGRITLDFAVLASVNPAGLARRGPHDLLGLPPGQPLGRGNGTYFCVSGPFPDTLPDPAKPEVQLTTTIEHVINGVAVGFHRVRSGPSTEVGLWDSPLRVVPLYD